MFIAMNTVALLFISCAYWRMHRAVRSSGLSLRSTQDRHDQALAQRFFIIVATDCLCWIPVIGVKLAALAGMSFSKLNTFSLRNRKQQVTQQAALQSDRQVDVVSSVGHRDTAVSNWSLYLFSMEINYMFVNYTEARSINHSWHGKAMSMFVALRIQHAMRVRRILSSSVACPALKYFSTLLIEGTIFAGRMGKLLNTKCPFLILCTTFVWNIFIVRRTEREMV